MNRHSRPKFHGPGGTVQAAPCRRHCADGASFAARPGSRPARASDISLAAGNTQTMTGVPADTLYHRWLGLHAPAMRRAVTVLVAGLIIALAVLPFAQWGLALVGGWDAAALTFLLTTWPVIIRADSS